MFSCDFYVIFGEAPSSEKSGAATCPRRVGPGASSCVPGGLLRRQRVRTGGLEAESLFGTFFEDLFKLKQS